MARLFVSHSSQDNAAALAIGAWLAEHGYSDVFLDIDADRGLVPGERWMDALRAASDRCEAVLCLISPDWLKSRWCMTEFLLARSLHKRILAALVAPVELESLPVEMSAEWQLCDLAGTDRVREFRVAETIVSFREAGLDLLRRGLGRAGLDARGFAWPPPGDPDRAPYRGLRALEAEDAPIFFGRDAAVVRGMDQLRGMAELGVDRLMLVLGASGAGKSSFLRAGLWPLLARDDAHFLPLPVIRPLDAVISGSAGLAVSVSGAFARLGVARPPGPVKAALAAGGAAALAEMLDELGRLAQARLVHVQSGARPPVLVVPVDQAEELFNSEGAAEAARFLSLFAAVLNGPCRVLVVGTIRTDRYHRVQSEALLPGVRRVLFDLSPIPASDYRQVIEGPARIMQAGRRRFAIDSALTERLIADATGADALPLLAFTLERLWADYGAQGRLTLDDYVAMGGVQGSIEAAVAGALARPDQAPAIPADTAAQNAALRAAFIPWLARVDPISRQALRRPARMEDIPGPSRAVVDRFVAARLLLADRRDGLDLIEVAHESLLRQWPRLVAWLDADAADLAQMEEVERAAAEWARNGRRDEWLDHRADRLEAAEALLRREDFRARLGEIGAAYVETARAVAERERAARESALARQARTQRNVWWALAAVAIVLMIGLGSAVLQYRATLKMQGQLDARQAALDNADVERLAEISAFEAERGQFDAALRIGVLAATQGAGRNVSRKALSIATAQLGGAVWLSPSRIALIGHSNNVSLAAWSRDGTRIVTTSNDRTARVWDAATGRQIAVLDGHTDFVSDAEFSPDGTRIVTAANDKTARIWDAATGRQIAVLNRSTEPVLSAVYSPDGTRIVTASYDNTVRTWEAATGRQIAVLNGHTSGVNWAEYSPDGTRILSASNDKTARVWDVATGRQIAVLSGHTDFVVSAEYSPDGSRIVTAGYDKTARVWDAATGQQIRVLDGHTDLVTDAEYSPDGTRIVTACFDNAVRVFDAATGRQITVLNGHTNWVSSAQYSPDGTRIVTASNDKTARVWDAATGRQIAVLNGHMKSVLSALYRPDGTRILTASNDNTVRVSEAASGRQIAVLTGHSDGVNSAAYSPDGSRIVSASFDKTARLWDAATGRQIAVLKGHNDAVSSAAYSPDGSRIVTASYDKTARIWEATTGRQIAVLNGHTDLVVSAAYSPDGIRIVTASYDKTARVWDAASGRQVAVLDGHGDAVNSANYSPDGSHIVTASHDKTARVWDAATGQQIGLINGHTDGVNSAAYSPDGRRIVTASKDKTARIWDAATGRQIAVIIGHVSSVKSAAYSPDGTRIVTASADKTARVWDVRDTSLTISQLLAEACGGPLKGLSKLTEAEMELVGVAAEGPAVDVCAGVALGR